MIDQAIQMALQKASIYHMMQKVFGLFELKGQKAATMKGPPRGKAGSEASPLQGVSGTRTK